MDKQEVFEQQQEVMDVIMQDGFAEYAKRLNLDRGNLSDFLKTSSSFFSASKSSILATLSQTGNWSSH
jgi:hypothetical protein